MQMKTLAGREACSAVKPFFARNGLGQLVSGSANRMDALLRRATAAGEIARIPRGFCMLCPPCQKEKPNPPAMAAGRPWWRIVLAAATLTGCAAPSSTRLHRVLEHELGRGGGGLPNYRCTIGAHRGASVAHRENTLAALLAAENDPRYAFVEFDVQFTRDRQIVLFHDRRLFRIYGKFTSVGEATYEELAALTGGDIARYEEAMAIVTKPVNLEIKSQGDAAEDRLLVDTLMADLRDRGRDRDVMISSISPDVVRYLNGRYPDMPTGLIFWLSSTTYLHWDSLTKALFGKIAEIRALT